MVINNDHDMVTAHPPAGLNFLCLRIVAKDLVSGAEASFIATCGRVAE